MSRRSSRNRETKERPTLIGRVVSLLLFAITISAVGALTLSLLAPYVASTHSWIFPLFGLMAPAIYIANMVLALYFITQWRWKFALPIIVLLLIGSSRVPLFFKMPISKDYQQTSYRGMVKFMSYNVRGLIDDQHHSAVDDIAQYIADQKADIICIQEYNANIAGKKGTLSKQLSRYNIVSGETNAIFSRYPIIRKGNLFEEADSLGGRSIYADLLIGGDTLRIINNHLNSNSIDETDKAYLRPTTVIRDKQRKERIKDIAKSFVRGSSERLAQVQVIRRFMDSTPYRYIVCGDFNDAPISFAYYELSRDMSDAFSECGEGFSHTYRGFYNLLRIDYILTSEGVTPQSYSVDYDAMFSDHYSVTSHLKIDK